MNINIDDLVLINVEILNNRCKGYDRGRSAGGEERNDNSTVLQYDNRKI